MAITRKDLRNEADHLPGSLSDVIELRRRLITELGVSRPKADGLIGWLIAKQAGEPDTTGPNVRSGYRKLLAQLGEPEPIGGPKKRGARSGGKTAKMGSPIILVGSVTSSRRRRRQRVLAEQRWAA